MMESVSAKFENVSADFGFGTDNFQTGSAIRNIHNCQFAVSPENAFLQLCRMTVLGAVRVNAHNPREVSLRV